jgi:3-hydroxyisobutyrate dehydrogenase-like beta-hydroxyacid dehydrogenase
MARCDLILSVCPPHAALEQATQAAAAAPHQDGWHYVDANAISPAHAEVVASRIEKAGGVCTDGGIIGPPPTRRGLTRLYLSGLVALEASEHVATPLIELHVIDDRVGSASALKLAYAAWTKGSAALLLAARAAAVRAGVEAALLEEWRTSQPGLLDRWESARDSARDKGWRWVGEMHEIASMFEASGLPAGFHSAAAKVFEDPTTLA